MPNNNAGFVTGTQISFQPLVNEERGFVQAEAMTSILPEVKFTLEEADEVDHYKPIAPLHGTDTAAGFDLYAARNVSIKPGESKLIPTGVKMAIPEGWFGMISPRSSIASKTPLRIGARIIDSDYRGDVMVNLHNDATGNGVPWEIKAGERIAQIVFMQHLVQMTQVDSLDDTSRGEGGFGSTGA